MGGSLKRSLGMVFPISTIPIPINANRDEAATQLNHLGVHPAFVYILLLDVLDKLGYFCVVFYVCRSRWPFDFFGRGGYKLDI